ncbi:MAG: hypothetical protein OXC57_15390 [Rhodobacteraceae bacterium]|nr:hypothetical protein [Paracoccaceae bacterium]
MKLTITNIVIGLINLIGISILLFVGSTSLQSLLGLNNSYMEDRDADALQTALSLGRLDLVTIILTFLGILIGIVAIVGFGYFRQRADTIAKNTADEVAREAITKHMKLFQSSEELGKGTKFEKPQQENVVEEDEK